MSDVWSYERIWELFEHGLRACGATELDREVASIYLRQCTASGLVTREEARVLIEVCPVIFLAIKKTQGLSYKEVSDKFPMAMTDFCHLLRAAKETVLEASSRVLMTHSEYIGRPKA